MFFPPYHCNVSSKYVFTIYFYSMWTFWKTKVKRTNLKFSYFLLVTFWCISCCFWLSAFLLDCGLLNSILKHQIWKWTGRFVKKAKMEKRRWQKFSDFNLCCYFLLSQPCSHHRLETWTKPCNYYASWFVFCPAFLFLSLCNMLIHGHKEAFISGSSQLYV